MSCAVSSESKLFAYVDKYIVPKCHVQAHLSLIQVRIQRGGGGGAGGPPPLKITSNIGFYRELTIPPGKSWTPLENVGPP